MLEYIILEMRGCRKTTNRNIKTRSIEIKEQQVYSNLYFLSDKYINYFEVVCCNEAC